MKISAMRPLVNAVLRNVRVASGGGCRARLASAASSSASSSSAQSTPAASSSDSAELNITDRCAERLRAIAAPGECLRVAVDGGGCSGFEYKVSIDTKINEDDRVFEKNGAKVLVDELSMTYVKGATVDFVEELIRSAFRITKNPIAEKGCSCGSSFAVRMD